MATLDDFPIGRLLRDQPGFEEHGKDSWNCCCPAHEDHNPSLHIAISRESGEPKLVMTCKAYCQTDEICQALGGTMAGLFLPKEHGEKKGGRKSLHERHVCFYTYHDASGEPVFRVRRLKEPKEFHQQRPSERGEIARRKGGTETRAFFCKETGGWWINCKPENGAYLWRLPLIERVRAELERSPNRNRILFWVEGEKDVINWSRIFPDVKFVTTTAPGGAGKNRWQNDYAEQVRGFDVIVIPDIDPNRTGENWAREVCRNLVKSGQPNSVRYLPLPGRDGLGERWDVTDWLQTWPENSTSAIVEAVKGALLAAEPITSSRDERVKRLKPSKGRPAAPVVRGEGIRLLGPPLPDPDDEAPFSDNPLPPHLYPVPVPEDPSIEAGRIQEEIAQQHAAKQEEARKAAEKKTYPPTYNGPLRNFRSFDDVTEPVLMDEILHEINTRTGNWPRRLRGGEMFAPKVVMPNDTEIRDENGLLPYPQENRLSLLSSPADTVSWLTTKIGQPVEIQTFPGCNNAAHIHTQLKEQCRDYRAVSAHPEHPAQSDVYYSCGTDFLSWQPESWSVLEEFLAFFNPAEPGDELLMLSAILSFFWSGQGGGDRPAFLLTSDDGYGSGKTAFVEMIAKLCGGLINLDASLNDQDMKKRLLSPSALSKRAVVFGNIRKAMMNNGQLEELLTAEEISGHALYVGEMSRRNVNYFLTANDFSCSYDMSSRVVVIKLRKPEYYSDDWAASVLEFIQANHRDIVINAVRILAGTHPSYQFNPQKTNIRFGSWYNSVLMALTPRSGPAPLPPDEIEALIQARQSEINGAQEEVNVIREAILEILNTNGYPEPTPANQEDNKAKTSNRVRAFFPSSFIPKLIEFATGDRPKNTRLASTIMTKGVVPYVKELQGPIRFTDVSGKQVRGYVWRGEDYRTELETNQDYADYWQAVPRMNASEWQLSGSEFEFDAQNDFSWDH